MDPLKYLFKKPALSERLALWHLLLDEIDITYVTQKSIEERASNLQLFSTKPSRWLSALLLTFPDESILNIEAEEECPNWPMYFDGAVNLHGNEIGPILISLQAQTLSGRQN